MVDMGNPSSGFVSSLYAAISVAINYIAPPIASMVPGTIFLPIGLLLNGWSAQNHVFWLVPDIVSSLCHCLPFFRNDTNACLRETFSSAQE